jgi:hypothetical protein
MFIKNETVRMREEAALTNLRHWTVGTERETEKPQSGFKQDTSQIQINVF